MKKVTALILTACLFFLLGGCAGQQAADEGKLQVYTSFYTMYDFTKKIGGDRIACVNLVPTGVEPHDWEPSTSDIRNLENADIVIYNGAAMETWAEKVIGSLSNDKLTVVEASAGIKLISKGNGEHDTDPHVWLNPQNAKLEMENIKNALVERDPDNKDYYEANYETYAVRLDELDKRYRTTLESCSLKDMVVAHEAFGYLCEAYGLNQVAIEGLQADSEPSVSRMAEIVDFVRENKVRYILYEELISPKVAETVAREAGVKTAMINPLEGLSEEAIQAGEDYFSVMESNLETLKLALE